MIVTESVRIPEHIAIMMDGNGRWATKRGLPRTAGHYAGMKAMREAIRNCRAMGIKCVTLYAFSTENWKRPEEEVNYLIHLPKLFFQDDMIQELVANNICIRFIGDLSRLPDSIQDIMQRAVELTADHKGMIVNFAMNYGGKADIIQAIQRCIRDGIDYEDITEENFQALLYTNEWSEPELVIRTSGERRLSNFLLWQSAKSELMFIDSLWPDFNEAHLKQAILEYQKRLQRA
ncbi:isoprenyl transferase [Paenibacillaceae sp. P-4]|uniref:isoprenyl transferase n=1 Tax=Paenibacillaceae bacterium P-4 TaxID=3160969 RepID=UPI00157FE448